MLKKLFVLVVIVVIVGLVYTESTGKTHFKDQAAELLLGEDAHRGEDEDTYTIVKPKKKRSTDPGEQAIDDAATYHSEAKEFARNTNRAVNDFNESVK